MSTRPRGTRLSAIAHELTQPLAALTNLIAAMQIALDQGEPGESIAALLAGAAAQTERARDIVRRLQEQIER
ncbi:sensor kinase two-component system [Sphingomonas sp. PAMC 26605]|uniref:sensor kinase two-component system n=1 Tax=Sphingomonas sp. PAMC 26605 TaxID=1112214 RepID=UPI00026CACCC|nr:sensor kinase two-component system [Sphingomonas sp. PAMC 26605]